MSVTSSKFGLSGAKTAEDKGSRFATRNPRSSILDPHPSIFIIFFIFFIVFILIKLVPLRLFVQIAYAFFTQEHLRAAVNGADAEGVFVIVAHEAAHLFAGVEHDDYGDLGGHQLFHVPGFHACALDGLRRSFLHDFLFAFLRTLLALLRAGCLTELPPGLASEFTAPAARLTLFPSSK